MANIPIRDITQTGIPTATSNIVFDDGSMKRATVSDLADGVRPVASQSEAQTGSDNSKTMSPLRVKQSIASEVGVTVASKSQGDAANTALQPAAIGSTVQAYDADLAAIAGLSPANNDFLQRKSGAWTNRTPAQAKADLSLSTVATSGAYADLSGLPTLGDLAAKNKAAVADIDATGTPSSTSALFGDGTWKTPAGGGDMVKTTYDPDNIGEDVFNASDAVTTPAIRRISKIVFDRADIRNWDGVDLSGSNDSASVVQRAVNDMASSGQEVHFPVSRIVLDSTITWGKNVNLVGGGQAGRENADQCSYFHITHSGIGFQTTSESTSPGGGSASRSMRGLNFMRTQPAIVSGWSPADHDFDIDVHGCYDVDISDCLFLNPSRLLQIRGNETTGDGAGRVNLRNVKGQPLRVGIKATQIYDTCFWDGLHFWPFWTHDANATSWLKDYGIAYQFGRIDNPKLGRLFSFGYAFGMIFTTQADVGSGALPGGTANLFHVDVFGADNTTCGVLVDSGVDGTNLHFNQLYVAQGTAANVPSLNLAGNNSLISIDRLTGYLSSNSLVAVTGSGADVTIGKSNSVGITGTEFTVVSGNKLRLLAPPTTSASVVYAGVGIETPDWRDYTPTVTSGSGSFTSVSAAGRYRRVGNTVSVHLKITVTINGSATTNVVVSLPIANGGRQAVFTGINDNNRVCAGVVVPNGSVVYTTTYDNSYPVADGIGLTLSGEYEL